MRSHAQVGFAASLLRDPKLVGQAWLGAGVEKGTGEGRRWASWGQGLTVPTRAELGMVGQDTESSTVSPEWSVWAA